jgi:pyruvate formate lyase activating enzyme
MLPEGLIFNIKRFSVNDGPGIRTTVFFKGCPLGCWWCHNPESRSGETEHVTITRTLHGREFCHHEAIGKTVTVEDVLSEIEKERVFYETSGGGVTFSGGEPLLQPDFLVGLAEACRIRDIHTCLDTSGYCEPLLFRDLIPKFDLFLFDIKVLDRSKHILYTGYPNDEILINLRQLDCSATGYIVRIPVVPGINDDEGFRDDLKKLLETLTMSRKEIHLLPYHPLAKSKMKMLGREYKMSDSSELDQRELHKFADSFQQAGYKVKIGG